MRATVDSLSSSPPLRIDELSPEERAVYATLKPECLPRHVAIIMDGNGRWAGRRSLKRFVGHQQGAKSVQLVTETASRIGLPWLTLYAFSLENNLRRPRAEVSFLMRLLKTYLESNVERMNINNVRFRTIGRTHELAPDVQDKIRWVEEETANNTGTTLTLALNYGGRSELLDAFRGLMAELKHKHLSPENVTEEDIHRHLYTAHMPDPDLLIRTSGEQRISNFPAVADRLHRDLRHRAVLAGLQGNPPARGHRGLPAPGTPLWRDRRRWRRSGRESRPDQDRGKLTTLWHSSHFPPYKSDPQVAAQFCP